MVDGLALGGIDFRSTVQLTGLRADRVQISGSLLAGGLILDQAVLTSELSLNDSRFSRVSMVACEASVFWFLNSRVSGEFDARSMTSREHGAHVRGSTFSGKVRFDDAKLGTSNSNSTFSATFDDDVDFANCSFGGETTFGRYSDLPPSSFNGNVKFNSAQFGNEEFGVTTFADCAFSKDASWRNARFYGALALDGVSFAAAADLTDIEVVRAQFVRDRSDMALASCAFQSSRVSIGSQFTLRVTVEGQAKLSDVVLSKVPDSIAISASDSVQIRRVGAEDFCVIELSSKTVSEIDRLQLKVGGEVRVSSPETKLTNCSFAEAAVVSTTARDGQSPSLETVSGTNCKNLALSGFGFQRTRFLGATNVDQLTITGDFPLATTSGFRARRRFIADEALARAHRGSKYWSSQLPARSASEERSVHLREVAALYRALRKGREDQRDEAGSADFYYGEMEMRRMSAADTVERLIVGLYWLLSGYGLRAWRAICILGAAILGSSLFLMASPLRLNEAPPEFGAALMFSLQSSISLSGPPTLYTSSAQSIQLGLRVIAPVLIALSVLAVRARVKR